MKKLFLLLMPLIIFGCGTDFFMNKPPLSQVISLSRGHDSLQVTAKTVVENDFFRSKITSEFYRGGAEIVYDKGKFDIKYHSLPFSKELIYKLGDDIYAAYFAGDYPYKSSHRRFGNVARKNGTKIVFDTDGYKLYEVEYRKKRIRVYNNISEHTILIESE